MCRRVSNQSRPSRCDASLCRRVSIQSRPALTGFEADGAPVENILPVLRSGRNAVRSEGQNVASRYSPQGSRWSTEKLSSPQVSSGPEKPAHGPENGPSVAAAIPAYAAAAE